MIDPLHSLAFSAQANPGVYAVLLGSGISRAAKIPTGWEVTLDFVRKLAEISGEPCEPSPEEWYRSKFSREPDYSEILAAIAKTPSERQQLLRSYWEPTEQEREEGAKLPTAAHRAIAAMVAHGYVKVIITTNFDRLMETALADVGVTPTVLSTPDQVHGAVPLIHTRCCIFKVHGDYLDTRIRNTPDELSGYPEEFDNLLDRIFDEFGLIICGWSADWDEALRQALSRAPSRRFSTYWAVVGVPSQAAQRLIDHRGALVTPIKDADSFFQTIQQQIQSLEEFSRPHPLSTEAAVASLKRYLSEHRFRIQLDDLVSNEIDRVIEATSGPKFAVQGGPPPDTASATSRVRAYEAICSTLLAMAPVGGFWAEKNHFHVWQRALERLATVSSLSGNVFWLELRRYPATLLFYALGLGAIEAGQLSFLSRLFTTPVHREHREDVSAVEILPPSCMFERGGDAAQILEGMAGRYAPLNDWLHRVLREPLRTLLPNDPHYTLMFDKLELLMALGYGHRGKRLLGRYWAPPGAFGYRRENYSRIQKEVEESISQMGEQSPYVQSGIFGNNPEKCTQELANFGDFMKEVAKHWW